MTTREASCHCGQLRLTAAGEPFAVSICNCLACQRRTGSAFGMQAGFNADRVQIEGRFREFTRISDESDRKPHVFCFCPDCGSQVFYTEPDEPQLVVVSVGAFADPSFPPPTESGYDSRRHPWVGLPASVARHAPELWETVRELYEAGDSRGGRRPRPRPARGTRRLSRSPLQRRVQREPRRSHGRCARAPPACDRAVGRLRGPRGRRLRLRPDPRRRRVPAARRSRGMTLLERVGSCA